MIIDQRRMLILLSLVIIGAFRKDIINDNLKEIIINPLTLVILVLLNIILAKEDLGLGLFYGMILVLIFDHSFKHNIEDDYQINSQYYLDESIKDMNNLSRRRSF